jgi:threonine synthase
MWKAFEELEALGWIPSGRRPRMVTVQAEGCAPIVRGFDQGLESGVVIDDPRTLADGLRVPRAIADFLMLRVLRASEGAAVAVSDESMVAAMRRLGAAEGVSAAPEGGAALVAVERLVDEGRITRGDTVVLFNTGGALKYLDVLT